MPAQLSATMEDYLEAIYDLHRTEAVIRVKDIANTMEVKMPSVTSALHTLKDAGYIRHEKYGHVELTPEGHTLAEGIHRRHITLVEFLTDILQLEPESADAEACQLEHGLSRRTLHRLMGLMEFIKRCPRSGGDWLEHVRGRWEDRDCDHDCEECIGRIVLPDQAPFRTPQPSAEVSTLDTQAPGFRGRVVKIAGGGPIRRRLMEMGVTAGTDIEFERVAPLGDPLEIKLRGYHLSLRRGEAAKVYVEPE